MNYNRPLDLKLHLSFFARTQETKPTCILSANISTRRSSGRTQLYSPPSPATLALTLNFRPNGAAWGGVPGGDCCSWGIFFPTPPPRGPPAMVEVFRSLPRKDCAPMTEPAVEAEGPVATPSAVTASTLSPPIGWVIWISTVCSASLAARAADAHNSLALWAFKTSKNMWLVRGLVSQRDI